MLLLAVPVHVPERIPSGLAVSASTTLLPVDRTLYRVAIAISAIGIAAGIAILVALART